MNHGVTTRELVNMLFIGHIATFVFCAGAVVLYATDGYLASICLFACSLYIGSRADRRYNIIRKKLGIYE